MGAFESLGNRLEGKGPAILYAVAGLAGVVLLIGLWSWWSGRRANEARYALGQAIQVAEADVSTTPVPGSTALTFPTERERAQKALEEFQKVANNYGDPYREVARYFAAAQLLTVDRARGLDELDALAKSGNQEVAARARFALAQAKESDGQLDAAAALYSELAKEKESVIPADSINLRLAAVYEKQGKKSEASDLLFRMVEEARKAQGKDGKPAAQSAAAREAADKLQTLDPARYAQLTPEPRLGNLPF